MSVPTGADATAAAVGAGLAAGACFAVGTVLQARAARQASSADVLHARLIADLARRPAWRWGIGVAVASYGLQALALSLGPIALVQPVIVSADLLFALPLAAALAGRRLRRRELSGAALVACGIAVFLASASPSSGLTTPPTSDWLLVVLAVYALVGLALLLARGGGGVRRTSLLAAAAGLTLGLMSALTKTFAEQMAARGLATLGQWQTWALAVVGFTSLVLSQSAFQAGPLAISLPLIDILEPLTAVLIAATVFAEKLALAPGPIAVETLGGLAVAGGIFILDRSPLVLAAQARAERPRVEFQPVGGGEL
jgi:drug/metabolite transporter (DMT)-like permease